MTRGRRKDLTIPPSRALLQQRDYRARKAKYISDLEERVHRAEDENERLKKELDAMRLRLAAGGSLAPSPEVVAASSELMHQLTTAAATLAKFQQIAFNEQAQAQAQAQAHALAQAQMQTQNLQPLPPPPPKLPPIQTPLHDQHSPNNGFHTLPRPAHDRTSSPRTSLHPSRHHSQVDYHHHSLSPPTPLAPPPTSVRESFPHLPPPLPDQRPTQRLSPPSLSPRGSTSTVASAAAAASASISSATASSSRMTVSHRTRTYTEYNEAESAWGYFDSQDLADDEEDEEDELYEDDHNASGLRHRMQDPRGNSLMSHSNGHRRDRDSPMRMREDSPMRTR